jgi:hypothetical protein
MKDSDKCIPLIKELRDRIQKLVGDIKIYLNAPLPLEEITEEEYRAALAEGEKLMAQPVTTVNRQRMEQICDLIETHESQFTDFSHAKSDTAPD